MRLHIGVGERWAFAAAVCYTTVNIILRTTAPRVDPYVGSLLRMVPIALLAWGVVLLTGRRDFHPRAPEFLGRRFVLALMGGGFMSFLVGNVIFFQALNQGGLGISVNGVQAGGVFSGILLSLLLLHEQPRREQVLGAFVIAAGLAFVALAQLGTPSELWYVGLVLALLAGTCYAVSNVSARMVQRARSALFVTLAGSTLGGGVPLLVLVLARAGWDPGRALAGADTTTVVSILVAGIANAAALISLTQAVRHTTIASLNTISSSQIVFSFVASVLLFSETGSPPMVAGVLLVVAGIVIAQIDRSRGRRSAGSAGAAQAAGSATGAAGSEADAAHGPAPEPRPKSTG